MSISVLYIQTIPKTMQKGTGAADRFYEGFNIGFGLDLLEQSSTLFPDIVIIGLMKRN